MLLEVGLDGLMLCPTSCLLSLLHASGCGCTQLPVPAARAAAWYSASPPGWSPSFLEP